MTPMRIGVDARHLSGKLTGIGRYIMEILNCMPEHLPNAHWTLYSRRPIKVNLPPGNWRIVEDTNPVFRQIPGVLWVKSRLGWLMRDDALDVVWAAATLAPIGPQPFVSTVYDLNHQIVPDTMPAVNRFAHNRWFVRDIVRASQVVSISSGTAMRLKQATGRTVDGVAPPGSQWARMGVRDRPIPLDEPYVLSVATREPRKNLNNLVEAFGMLKRQGRLAKHVLVLVGAPGWGPELDALRGGKPSWLREFGYVQDEDMAALFASADVLAQPSIYEGFGMPAAEAAALGTRVLATDIPELREAAGGAGVFVGTSVREIADGLLRVLEMPRPDPRPGNSWSDSAAVVAAALQRAVDAGAIR